MKQTQKYKKNRFPLGTISLTDVLDMCARFIEPPVPEEKLDDPEDKFILEYRDSLKEKLNQIKVLPYLPLMDKVLILSYILHEKGYMFQSNSLMRIVELERSKFWDGLLQYTNITISMEEEQFCDQNAMDVIMTVLAESFEAACGADYRSFCQMIDNSLFLESVEELTSALSAFDTDSVKEYTEQAEKLVGGLTKNKGLVSNLAVIMAGSIPELRSIQDKATRKERP